MYNFLNKRVIIVGAGTGIGRAVAIKFAESGARVACLSKNYNNCHQTAESAGTDAIAVECDISNPESVDNAMTLSTSFLDGLDILINTAGINIMQHSHLSYINDFDNIIKTNLNGTFYTCRFAINHMITNDTNGCIINTSSAATNISLPWSAGYVASKYGVVGLTKELAYEYKNKNIRINAVSPGGVDTPFVQKQNLPEDADFNMINRFIADLIPVNSIADLYLYLSSNHAKHINGSIFNIDAGISL